MRGHFQRDAGRTWLSSLSIGQKTCHISPVGAGFASRRRNKTNPLADGAELSPSPLIGCAATVGAAVPNGLVLIQVDVMSARS